MSSDWLLPILFPDTVVVRQPCPRQVCGSIQEKSPAALVHIINTALQGTFVLRSWGCCHDSRLAVPRQTLQAGPWLTNSFSFETQRLSYSPESANQGLSLQNNVRLVELCFTAHFSPAACFSGCWKTGSRKYPWYACGCILFFNHAGA